MNKMLFALFEQLNAHFLGCHFEIRIMLTEAYEEYLTIDPASVYESEEEKLMFFRLFDDDKFINQMYDIEQRIKVKEGKNGE